LDAYRTAKVKKRKDIDKAKAAGKQITKPYRDPKTGKVRQRKVTALAPVSINETLQVLSAILEMAVEYGYVPTAQLREGTTSVFAGRAKLGPATCGRRPVHHRQGAA
jgi:hypothetical protein